MRKSDSGDDLGDLLFGKEKGGPTPEIWPSHSTRGGTTMEAGETIPRTNLSCTVELGQSQPRITRGNMSESTHLFQRSVTSAPSLSRTLNNVSQPTLHEHPQQETYPVILSLLEKAVVRLPCLGVPWRGGGAGRALGGGGTGEGPRVISIEIAN